MKLYFGTYEILQLFFHQISFGFPLPVLSRWHAFLPRQLIFLYDQGTHMILVVAKTSLKNAYVLGK